MLQDIFQNKFMFSQFTKKTCKLQIFLKDGALYVKKSSTNHQITLHPNYQPFIEKKIDLPKSAESSRSMICSFSKMFIKLQNNLYQI